VRRTASWAATPGLWMKAATGALLAKLALLSAPLFPTGAFAQETADPVIGFARQPVHVATWPDGKKVAVSFALFVEEFGFRQGPVFRPNLASRNPDLVNEAFRQYRIDRGVVRVGRLLKELDAPLTIVLNAEFPSNYPSVWKEFRASQLDAPIVAHGMNNTSRMLPWGEGLQSRRSTSAGPST
jgi:allantoinase